MIHKGKTKIVATLGPASSSYEIIYKLIEAGASMFRLNTSHGTVEGHLENIKNIRNAAKELNTHIPILVDLQGPKIRVGNIPEPVKITKDEKIRLKACDYVPGLIPVDYAGIADDVKTGDKILLDDGKVGLEVLGVKDCTVQARVLYGDTICPRKGINLPGSTASLDAVTERDVEFIKFAIENGVDYIAQSFVREAEDIHKAKKYINRFGGNIPVIAKIEKPQAVENLEEIVKTADGIMVARGDLGIEMSPADVPIVQKIIIKEAIKQRKVCIVATQMLETMMEEPIPTRAETSDVANAIMDGADAVMLSGETAAGKYPVEAVSMMRKIADNTEESKFCKYDLSLDINDDYELSPQAIANAAVKMAQDLNAKAILAFSHTGYTPKLLAKLRSSVPVMAISDLESTCRRLNLYWGLDSYYKEWDEVLSHHMLEKIDKFLFENTKLKKDERIIIIGSIPKLITGRTNFIRVHRIGAPEGR
ncbi:MAG: pyruvate kinase [Candidatus Gastranaerophilales bacterium]|nr:pyruvate kinase [Candidatus Gastranaerophilales bacterium]MCM1072806.1 pyruvate kinase [Bacteroides sp.]